MASPGSGWQQRAICTSRLSTPTTVNAVPPPRRTLRGARTAMTSSSGGPAVAQRHQHAQVAGAVDVEAAQHRRQVRLAQAHALEFAVEQLASVLQVARAVELVEPGADLFAGARAGQVPAACQQPVSARL